MVLIPALPLLATLVTAALGKKYLGEKSHLPALAAIIGSFVLSLMLLDAVSMKIHQQRLAEQNSGETHATMGYEKTFTLWQWAMVDDASTLATPSGDMSLPLSIDVTLRADTLTCIMLSMVTFISSLVVIYAAGYMHGDPGYWRFFTYVSLFVFSMTMLVSASNFVMLYVFWEAVGVCSYLLVGFWFEKPAAAAAGKKAFLVNRIGDFSFVLGIFLIWTTFGTLNFHDTIAPHEHAAGAATDADHRHVVVQGVLGQSRLEEDGYQTAGSSGVMTAICLLLLLGACGKSAQFPLYVWLPDAMEGPTPVSALIHAATMVTAGVYMVTRCTPLFLASPDAQLTVSVIGGFTALLAGAIAITQNDLKRVLAYSTVSQLGYMFLGLGVGTVAGITAGMFHLFTHAFFKALLFLGAGSVMHAMGGVIDMRQFSGLKRLMPTTRWTFLIGCLALAGVVPFAGFFSKDEILAAVHHGSASGSYAIAYEVLYYLGLLTALMTAFYTFRAYLLTFHGEERIPPEAGHHAHESPPRMTMPLLVLAFCSAIVGLYYWASGDFAEFLHETPSLAYAAHHEAAHAGAHAAEGSHLMVAAVSTVVALAGIGLALLFYREDRSRVTALAGKLRPLYEGSLHKFYIDEIYQVAFVWPLMLIGKIANLFDRWVVDGLVDLVGKLPPLVGARLRSLQIGLVPFYALAMVLGLLVLLGTLLKWPLV
jgi:NADH-quinone oxidoreductase subunit L